jgi:hypothetical protein
MRISLVANVAKDIKADLSLSNGMNYSVQNMGNICIFIVTDQSGSIAPSLDKYSFRLEAGQFISIKSTGNNGIWFLCSDNNIAGIERMN